jgi:hypothetical protein
MVVTDGLRHNDANFTDNQDWFRKNLMNDITFAQNKTWLILGLLLLVFFLAACGSDTTETEEPTTVETEEPTAVETEAEPQQVADPTEVPTEVSAIEFDGVVADTFPCEATIIPSTERRLNVRFREPTTDQALMVGPLVPETPIRLIEVRDVEGTVWYRTENPANNISFHWIEARYIVLGEGCVSGG